MDSRDRKIAVLTVRPWASSVRIWRAAHKKLPQSSEIAKHYERSLVDFGESVCRQKKFIERVKLIKSGEMS